MNSKNILFGLAVLTIYCVTLSHSLQCYSCTDKKSCKNPKKFECTSGNANATKTYLDATHKNVVNTTSPYLECFAETIKGSNGDFYYKGCIYSNIRGCSLELKDFYNQGKKKKRDCNQCANKNGCNPAGRAELHVAVPLLALVLAIIGKFVRSN